MTGRRMFVVGVAVVGVAVVADLIVLVGDATGPVASPGLLLWATVLWASVVAVGGIGVVFGLRVVASPLLSARGWRRALGQLLVASPFVVATWFGTAHVLSGPGISGQEWVERARLVAKGASVFGPWFAVRIVHAVGLRWAESAPAFGGALLRRGLWAAGAVGVAVLLWLDRRYFPEIYDVAHLLLWMGALSIVAVLAGVSVGHCRWPRAGVAWCGSVVLCALAATPWWVDPLASDPVARAAAWRDTVFLRRALAHLAPGLSETPLQVDAGLLEALGRAPALASDELDRLLPGRQRFNVLLLTVDALRADRVGASRDGRELAPNLDRLRATSISFDRAWTPAPVTLAAFSAILRSRYFSATDVCREELSGKPVPAAERQATLPEILARAGWRTEAVTGINHAFMVKLQRGFATFNRYPKAREISGEEVTGYALAAIDRSASQPWFLWAHYFDPHEPYRCLRGRPFGERSPDLYDAEVLYADGEVGRLLRGLHDRGLDERTVIVMLSDHGEEWDAQGRANHAYAVTERQLHVPFCVRVPGLPPRRISVPVSTLDAFPTLLELLGVDAPRDLHGHSRLRALIAGDAGSGPGASSPAPVAFAETIYAQVRRFAAVEAQLKLTFDANSGVHALYDLATDPEETVDLSARRDDDFQRLRRVLDTFRSLLR